MLVRQLPGLIKGEVAGNGSNEICRDALREFKIDLPPVERGIGDQLFESALHLPNIGADITGQEINNSRRYVAVLRLKPPAFQYRKTQVEVDRKSTRLNSSH